MYSYRCQLIRVYDADTLWLDLDLGLDIHQRLSIRLAYVNAPERGTPAGDAATQFVRDLLERERGPLLVQTIKDRKEKFGRYLGVLVLPSGEILNDLLVESGHAEPYPMPTVEDS